VQGVAIFRLTDAKVDDAHFVWDKFALLQQIGALPAAGPAGAQVASCMPPVLRNLASRGRPIETRLSKPIPLPRCTDGQGGTLYVH